MDRAKALKVFCKCKRDMLRVAYGNLSDREPATIWSAPPEYLDALEVLGGYGNPQVCKLHEDILESVKNEFGVRD